MGRTERVYNIYLEGGGNIIINTSRQPGVTILTTAATMGYLFTPTPDSQQSGFLTYPVDIRSQLGLRQDLSKGNAHFQPGDVKTLSNGELIFKNITSRATSLQIIRWAWAQSSPRPSQPHRVTARLPNSSLTTSQAKCPRKSPAHFYSIQARVLID